MTLRAAGISCVLLLAGCAARSGASLALAPGPDSPVVEPEVQQLTGQVVTGVQAALTGLASGATGIHSEFGPGAVLAVVGGLVLASSGLIAALLLSHGLQCLTVWLSHRREVLRIKQQARKRGE